MKTVSANLKSHIAQEVTTLCTCWLATRKDGQAFGFTNFSDSLTVDGMIYAADSGHSPSAVQTSSGLAVDNLEVAGILSSASITEADIMAGKWDYAVIEIFKVNRADLTQGRLHLRKGWLGEIKFGKAGFIAELRGLTQAYQQIVGNVYTAACRANLGRCQMRRGTGRIYRQRHINRSHFQSPIFRQQPY